MFFDKIMIYQQGLIQKNYEWGYQTHQEKKCILWFTEVLSCLERSKYELCIGKLEWKIPHPALPCAMKSALATTSAKVKISRLN